MSVTVTAVNDAPVAVDDTKSTNEDTPLSFPATDLSANDTDVDGTTPTVTAVSNPTGGTVALTGGTITFTPTANFTGTAGFDYTLSDGTLTDTGHVTVTVTAVNDPPVAVGDTVTTDANTPAVIPTATLTGNDTDIDGGPLTVTAVSGPTNGTVVLNGDNTITFTPTAELHRDRRVRLHRLRRRRRHRPGPRHGHRHRPSQRRPRREQRLLQPSSERDPQRPRSGVLANDTDADGNPLTAVLVTGPAHGTLTLNPNGSFTYTPTSSFVGSDSFTYTANDGTLNSNTATVTITDNIAPTAVDVQATNTSGQTPRRLDQGDTIVFTFSEPIDPNSIVAGWDGTGSTPVVIRLSDTQLLEDDEILVYNAANSAQLPLGVVDLDRTDYVGALFGEGNVTYGATGDSLDDDDQRQHGHDRARHLRRAGRRPRQPRTGEGNGKHVLEAKAGLKDFAGNPLANTGLTESGAEDNDF